MSDPRGSARLFGRRKEELAAAKAATAVARDAMTQALYDMESRRRGMAVRAEFAALDNSAEGRRLKADFDALGPALDDLSQAYITVLAAHDVSDDLDLLRGSEATFYALRDRLLNAVGQLADFEHRSAKQVARVEGHFSRSRAAMAAAAGDLETARAAIASATAAGLRSTVATASLAGAETKLAQARQAADRYADIDRVSALAADAAAQAREAARLAGELPQLRQRVQTRLASIRTRLQAVAGRAGPVDDTLHELRRDYAYPAFADLADTGRRLSQHVTAARDRIAEAERRADAQEWEAAATALTTAGAELSAGDALAQAVLDRAHRLREVAADPRAPFQAARFAVRDAQRLVLGAGQSPPERFVHELDELAARLDGAPNLLVGTHPDYWAYLRALDSVQDGVRVTVERIRHWIAGR